ncbi:hypothetical protein R1sor_016588 [Riccia sorocarpa]|uniref:Reverse transcriptase domain-containing protein n=1 Tax=Riccia sorocarpa TaxID=122646 RepID=A0ABD3HJG1_9MARC
MLMLTLVLEDLEEALKEMATGRSPGEDGVTLEVVTTMWESIKSGCLLFIQTKKERLGEIQGVLIPRGKSLLHRLFADDSGVSITASEANFQSLKKIIECFEGISGASLNMSKSVIVPMAMEHPPAWVYEQGCQIMEGGDQMTYLGFKAGI